MGELIRGHGLKPGTLHTLMDRDGARSTFQWTGKSWSTPGTWWGTRPAMMMALGWTYHSGTSALTQEPQ